MKTINKMIMMFVCLLLPIGAGAQDSRWTCDTHAYEYDMTVYFTLSTDGSVVDNMSNYEVAAFCGDVCRGISKILTVIKNGHETTYGYIRIRSNQATGETISFKVYAKDTSRELDIEDFTLTFQSQKAIGLPSNPQELHIPYFIIGDADGDGSIQIDPVTGDTITKTDDTPLPGIMKYNPDEPDIINIFEDTDGDDVPDTWVPYPIVWEDVDGDDKLEAGLDRDGDGHIDDIDGDDDTQQPGDNDKDPSDGNPNNPGGKDVILIHYDSDGDGDVDDDDEWIQIQKDPDTGIITPAREVEDASIEFTATVQEWEELYSLNYNAQI